MSLILEEFLQSCGQWGKQLPQLNLEKQDFKPRFSLFFLSLG
jgi:hypothetical protein